jgi:hypothetical protein
MAAKGLDMKFISEIRRLKQLKFTKRRAARALGVHRNTITRYWDEESIPAAKAVSVDSSETLSEAAWTANIDWQGVRDEVLKGVSLSVLFEEQQPKIPVNYASFWKQLQKRAPTLKGTMVRVFKPGTRTEIDYCDGISLLNIATGEMIKTELFVGVLCSSRYTLQNLV